MRYPKKYTVREWSRFSWTMQERLCVRYNVFLTDHATKSEKLGRLVSKINVKNVNKAIDAISKGVNDFSKTMEGMNFGMSKREYNELLGDEKKDYSGLLGKKKDYSFLTNRVTSNSKRPKRQRQKKNQQVPASYFWKQHRPSLF